MTTLASFRRGGFTLIELMVVIGVIAFIAGLTMLVVPTILDRDRTVDAVTTVEGWLQNARIRATRDNKVRGVRFIVNQGGPPYLCTEAQYIELPPTIVLGDGSGQYRDVLTGQLRQYPLYSPRVVFTYGLDSSNQLGGTAPPRACELQNIDVNLSDQVKAGATLFMPVLDPVGTYQIKSILGTKAPNDPNDPNSQMSVTIQVELESYPDAQMGAGTNLATYHFAISGQPRPLLGEPVMQLPANTCVDLSPNVSQPWFTGVPGQVDYDVLFSPGGQTVRVSTGTATGAPGQIFLWVRDFRKVPTMDATLLGWNPPFTGAAPQAYMDALKQGGEQMIVVIKGKSSGIGAAPVYWPDANSSDVYLNARKAVSGP